MNKFTKLALPAMGMILVGASSLVTATYAWFTTGNKATIGQINLNVQAAEGLLIGWGDDEAASGFKWTSALSLTDGNAPTSAWLTNGAAKELKPISTTGVLNLSNSKPVFFTGTVDSSDTNFVTATQATDESAYVKFSIMMKNESQKNKDIILQADDGASQTKVLKTEAGNDSYAELATRIGFGKTAKKALTAGADKTDDKKNLVIFEPNSTTHIPAVGGSDKLTYSAVIDGADGKTFGIKDGKDKTTPSTIWTQQVTTQDNLATKIITLEKQSITYLDVYIWLEGQDADCLNYVSGHPLAVSLVFGMIDAQ